MEVDGERARGIVFDAVRNGDIRTIEEFLYRGFDVNTADDAGETLLIKAAFAGRYGTANLLLTREANVNAYDSRLRQNPLIRAARVGNALILRLLINNGADLNAVDHQLHTALMKATASGHVACVSILVERGAVLNAVDGSGMTALMKAAYIGHSTILGILSSYGATLDLKNANGNSALKIAAGRGNVECLRFLLAKGADPCASDVLVKIAVNWFPGMKRDKEQLLKDFDCVRRLCGAGACLNVKDDSGNTLFMRAVAIGFMECVVFLCERPTLFIDLTNDSGETALMIAAKTLNVGILRICLEKGASVNIVDMAGQTAIMHAANADGPACVEALVSSQADPNVVDAYRWTPLMYMARGGRRRTVEMLTRYGALVDHRNIQNQTAIDVARASNQGAIVNFLEALMHRLRGWREDAV